MKEALFRGLCTAVITPFDEEGPDLGRMKEQLDRQLAGGAAAVVLAGTTGENATLTAGEYERMVAACTAHIAGRIRVIVGIGGNSTLACVERARFAADAGADAVLMCPPYYNKTSPAGLLEHFRYVADRSPAPLVLYNVPSRTAIGIPAEAYLELSRHPNVNGVKEASGDFSLASRIVSECGDALRLYCGNDDQTLPMMALGADGVVSVASNVAPAELARLTADCLAGNYAAARERHRRLSPLFRLLFAETNPIPVKSAMAMLGLDSGLLRLPLREMDPTKREALREALQDLGLPEA